MLNRYVDLLVTVDFPALTQLLVFVRMCGVIELTVTPSSKDKSCGDAPEASNDQTAVVSDSAVTFNGAECEMIDLTM